MNQSAIRPVRRVAVIGAGTIGASWAACFLARGLEVVGYDPSPAAPDLMRRMVAQAWPVLERLGAVGAGADPARWRFEADPVRAVEGADFVQESAPERYEAKHALLPRIASALPADVVIASSTSGLLASRLSEGCAHPERVLIGHPFNPPHLIPLVEVVGPHASRASIDAAMAFYRMVGKHPIEIRKEVPGHVANRLQAAMWREAVHLVAEGVASVADVDAAVSEGPGLRWALMGPSLTFHLAGGQGGMAHFLDHLLPAMQGWWKDLGQPEVTPVLQQRLAEGVAEEAAGRSVEDLARWRDEALVRLLVAREAKGG
jgi:3-hydroxyacyl-CoA dehydrogenase